LRTIPDWQEANSWAGPRAEKNRKGEYFPIKPVKEQTGDAMHRLSLKHANLGDPAHIFFISVPQVHLPGF
jgi:hypothetical protein